MHSVFLLNIFLLTNKLGGKMNNNQNYHNHQNFNLPEISPQTEAAKLLDEISENTSLFEGRKYGAVNTIIDTPMNHDIQSNLVERNEQMTAKMSVVNRVLNSNDVPFEAKEIIKNIYIDKINPINIPETSLLIAQIALGALHLKDLLPQSAGLELNEQETLSHHTPPDILNQIFPTLLNKLSTFGLIEELLMKNQQGKTPIKYLKLDQLTKTELIRFAGFKEMLKGFVNRNWFDQDLSLIEPFTQYLESERSFQDFEQEIHALNLSSEEHNEMLANYIECKKLPLSMLNLNKKKLLSLSKHLRYINLEGFSSPTAALVGAEIIQNCPHPYKLILDNEEIIKNFSTLSNCEILYCKEFPNLDQLPKLPNCIRLDCIHCDSLTTLPPLPRCKAFNLKECNNIIQIPDLLLCKSFHCLDCSGLRTIPFLPVCQDYLVEGCTSLVPETDSDEMNNDEPFNVAQFLDEIRSEEGDSDDDEIAYNEREFNVDLDELSQNPEKILIDLNQLLVADDRLPRINYYKNGEKNIATDEGGVRRDFMTRLFENLFLNERDLSKKSKNFLKFDLQPDGECYPSISPDNQENEMKSYQAIGRIMAHCASETSSFKIHLPFSEAVYHCIATPLNLNEEMESWFITNYFYLKEIEWMAPLFLGKSNKIPEIEEENYFKLKAMIEALDVELKEDQSPLQYLELHRAELLEKALKEALQDKRLIAISFIVEGLRDQLGTENWSALIAQGGKLLQKQIEGEIDSNFILQRIRYKRNENITQSQKEKIETFLKTWIEKGDAKKLSSFVRAVTGMNTLGTENHIEIEIQQQPENYLPVAHTCYFSIEIPSGYESQEKFDFMLDRFLEESLAGDGFSIS